MKASGTRKRKFPMNLPTRRLLLRLIIASLSITATLGIIVTLWNGLGDTGAKIISNAMDVDVASVLALCCAGPAKSALHPAVQLSGLLSAFIGLATRIYITWWGVTSTGLEDGVRRAATVLLILAIASAHGQCQPALAGPFPEHAPVISEQPNCHTK